jgi:sterol desaturase/sphingolipid hydroxylase (fatty acid hydroxylase superfamily)
MPNWLKRSITHGLYPLMLFGVLTVTYLAIDRGWNATAVYFYATLAMVATLLAVERLMPMRRDWSMTLHSAWRDLRYIAFVAPTIAILRWSFSLLAVHIASTRSGPMSAWPLIPAAIAYLLAFELLQYGAHRFSHSNRGAVGRFLWRAHATHHLPDRVYVLMHAVFHPVNAFLNVLAAQIPLLLMGPPPGAVLLAMLLIDLQSLVSHFNADMRAGYFNYVFIGTELHRHHHRADQAPHCNFGNTLTIWDQVFGTFDYRPGQAPMALGVYDPREYPPSEQVLEVLALPFRGDRRSGSPGTATRIENPSVC